MTDIAKEKSLEALEWTTIDGCHCFHCCNALAKRLLIVAQGEGLL